MYSVVLMMAMTGGGDAPAGLFSHHSCHGCTGAPVATCCGTPVYAAPVYASCTGSCTGSCHGHKLFGHKHHSCSGCSGYVATPYTGCTGYATPYAGCVGGTVIVPPVAPPTPPKETIPPPKKEEKKPGEISAPATLIVNVPANAVLTIDGNATSSTSAHRVFESPILEAGRQFNYTIQATFSVEGRPVVLSKTVTVTAGTETVVDFNLAVASR